MEAQTADIKSSTVNLLVYFGIGIIATIILFILGKQVLRYFQNAQKQNLLNNSVATAPNGVTVDLGERAAQIHDSFYNNDPFGITEDEDRAMDVLKSVPKALIPHKAGNPNESLTDTYFGLYAKNLKDDFIKYLSPNNYSSISYQFN